MTAVVVTRDSEWDEVTQARAEADQYLIDTTHPACGQDLHLSLIPPGEAGAPRWFTEDSEVCQACASLEGHERKQRDAHKDDKPTVPGMPLWMDGRIFRVRQATPDEVAESEGRARD